MPLMEATNGDDDDLGLEYLSPPPPCVADAPIPFSRKKRDRWKGEGKGRGGGDDICFRVEAPSPPLIAILSPAPPPPFLPFCFRSFPPPSRYLITPPHR